MKGQYRRDLLAGHDVNLWSHYIPNVPGDCGGHLSTELETSLRLSEFCDTVLSCWKHLSGGGHGHGQQQYLGYGVEKTLRSHKYYTPPQAVLHLARVGVTTGSMRRYMDPTVGAQIVQLLDDGTSTHAFASVSKQTLRSMGEIPGETGILGELDNVKEST